MGVARKPPACFEVRTAVISLRERKSKDLAQNYTVVCPAEWSKSQFLDYVRKVHPDDAVKLLRWNAAFTTKGQPVLWLCNPRAFSNYKKGILK